MSHAGSARDSRSLVDTCVHCGFCLPACPTYVLWGDEMDSPRGRIYLMKAALEGRAAMSPSFVRHFDACLGCLSCVTACPSGVQYDVLIGRTRAQIEEQYDRPLMDRLFRAVLFRALPYPGVLRLVFALLWLVRPLLSIIEWADLKVRSYHDRPYTRLRALIALAPRRSAPGTPMPVRTPANGTPRLTVALLTGCVQHLVFPGVNRATATVLAAEGCEVLAPAGQGCCGALSYHAGRLEEARSFARRTIETFERTGAARIVVNSAGCGSSMKEYGELLADDPAWAARAGEFSARVRDVSEVLAEMGQPRAPRHPLPIQVAYQDACHLAHAQRVRMEPRQMLASIPELTIRDIPEADMCCGSAGIYNLVQPEPASTLGDRKARHLAKIAPDVIATGNPGCRLQLEAACDRVGFVRPILHPIELLDASIRGVAPDKFTGAAEIV